MCIRDRQGGLPRPVVAEQGDKFSRQNIERNGAQGDQRSEALFNFVEAYAALPNGGWSGSRSGRGQGGSLAFYQIAEVLLDAGVFALVIFFTDGAGLAAQFQAEQDLF